MAGASRENSEMQGSEFVIVTPSSVRNRDLTLPQILLSGAALGAVSYCLVEASIGTVDSPFFHDLELAAKLGFVYPAAVAFWLGWFQRSWKRAAAGIPVALAIGFTYTAMIISGNFLMIMVGFPCLLGGAFASILGSNRSEWANQFFHRGFKGLAAGLGLGLTYMLVLNVLFGVIYPGFSDTEPNRFVKTMWQAGPVALASGSALFLLGILWAIGLKRITLQFEADHGVGFSPELIDRKIEPTE
jgi:hypothetical protein